MLCHFVNKYFSEAPKDLIRKLLVLDPNERLTVDGALEHPFFNIKVS